MLLILLRKEYSEFLSFSPSIDIPLATGKRVYLIGRTPKKQQLSETTNSMELTPIGCTYEMVKSRRDGKSSLTDIRPRKSVNRPVFPFVLNTPFCPPS